VLRQATDVVIMALGEEGDEEEEEEEGVVQQ
jgi:hypothetical protein